MPLNWLPLLIDCLYFLAPFCGEVLTSSPLLLTTHCFSSFHIILQVSDFYFSNKAWCEKYSTSWFWAFTNKLHWCCPCCHLFSSGEWLFLNMAHGCCTAWFLLFYYFLLCFSLHQLSMKVNNRNFLLLCTDIWALCFPKNLNFLFLSIDIEQYRFHITFSGFQRKFDDSHTRGIGIEPNYTGTMLIT